MLLVFYSRDGHTAQLAAALANEFMRRGHTLEVESIQVRRDWNKWLLPIPLLPLLPFLPFYLTSAGFRRFWHRHYWQPEQAVLPLAVEDVSGYDLILLGTPKWLYLSYPVARWLKMVRGLEGKNVAAFATYCGPPFRVFETEMLFGPLQVRLHALGARLVARLGISSDHHPYFFAGEMRGLFRWLSRKHFARPLADFTLEGEVGGAELERFCNEANGPKMPVLAEDEIQGKLF